MASGGEGYAVKWLLLAQLAVIVPLMPIIPLWMVAVWALFAWWYWQIISAAWPFPSAVVKVGLVTVSVLGIYLQYRQWLALEPMVATLVLAVLLKLIEMKTRRDRWLVLLLCYFVLACRFLFEQQISALFVATLQVLILLLAQQAMYRQRPAALASLRLAAVMLLQALPLMLFLFLVFPRIGPLWSMPLPSVKAQTGMSDSLRFGDIAELSQSGALAFRVTFDGLPPAPAQRYWRGLVLEHYRDGHWTVDRLRGWRRPTAGPLSGPQIDYTVTLESGVHNWLYTLAVGNVRRDDIYYAGSYQWLPSSPLTGRLQYHVRSALDQPRLEADAELLRRNLRLSGQDNPRARALAARWREQYAEPALRVSAALNFFATGDFGYTLKPPLLGRDNVDDFIFDSLQGFCEHYAGSFVFLMRAAGVPARIVVGYQGGEFNDSENYLLVHQSDAHAWAEVWLDGVGWQRIDPTQTVAPDRVALGADLLLRDQLGFLAGSPFSLRNFSWARDLRLYLDSVNYAWAKWVLNYDSESQTGVLSSLLGEINVKRMLLALLICVALPLAVVALSVLGPSLLSRPEPALRYYLAACRALARRTGLRQQQGETAAAFLTRVQCEAPRWAAWFGEMYECFERCYYRADSTAEQLAKLRKLRRPRKAAK